MTIQSIHVIDYHTLSVHFLMNNIIRLHMPLNVIMYIKLNHTIEMFPITVVNYEFVAFRITFINDYPNIIQSGVEISNV